MKFLLLTLMWACITPSVALTEIPMPFRSNSLLKEAENIIVCSDFPKINASRLSRFLSELDQSEAASKIIEGPRRELKAMGFNALVVVTGTETKAATNKCASDTVPYGNDVKKEIQTAIQKLLEGFVHPNPKINAAFSGKPTWHSSNYYHNTQNWVTVVIAMREPLTDQTMIRLFDLPDTACDHNSACKKK